MRASTWSATCFLRWTGFGRAGIVVMWLVMPLAPGSWLGGNES